LHEYNAFNILENHTQILWAALMASHPSNFSFANWLPDCHLQRLLRDFFPRRPSCPWQDSLNDQKFEELLLLKANSDGLTVLNRMCTATEFVSPFYAQL